MRGLIIAGLALAAIIVAFWLWHHGGSEAAGTARDAVTAPVDAINTDLEFKDKADLEARMVSSADELKQLDAMGTDDPKALGEALARADRIDKDLADARARNSPSVDSLVRSNHWQEIEDLATRLRAKLPAAAP